MTERHKQNIREALKKKWATPEFREYMRGRSRKTEAMKKNISEARIGMKFSDSHKQNLSKNHRQMSGTDNHNWKGGISANKVDRVNANARRWKQLVLQRDNFTCQICETEGGHLHIDHIKPYATHPELRHEVSNGRTLCRACHYYVTFKRKLPKGSKWGLVKLSKYKEC